MESRHGLEWGALLLCTFATFGFRSCWKWSNYQQFESINATFYCFPGDRPSLFGDIFKIKDLKRAGSILKPWSHYVFLKVLFTLHNLKTQWSLSNSCLVWANWWLRFTKCTIFQHDRSTVAYLLYKPMFYHEKILWKLTLKMFFNLFKLLFLSWRHVSSL